MHAYLPVTHLSKKKLTCYPISKRSQQGYQHHRESLWMSCLIDKVESNMLGSLVLFVFWGKYVWDMCVYNTSGNQGWTKK